MIKRAVPTNTVSLNRFKKFEVELEISVFESLLRLYETDLFEKDIDRTAEVIFYDWVRLQLPKHERKSDLLWQRAKHLGYVPVISEEKMQNPDTFGVVYVTLGGMPRYIVEHLPRAEPTSALRNPYYQYSSEQMIAAVLREEVGLRIEEFKQGGFFDEDDLS